MNDTEAKRFIDHLRDFGGAVRAAGPAVAAIVLAHLAGAAGPASIFGDAKTPGLADLGLTAIRDAVTGVVKAARLDVQLRGPAFEQQSLVACFQDHAVPIFADIAGAVLAKQTTGVTAGSEPAATEQTASAPTGKRRAAKRG